MTVRGGGDSHDVSESTGARVYNCAVYPSAILLPVHVISLDERNGDKRAAFHSRRQISGRQGSSVSRDLGAGHWPGCSKARLVVERSGANSRSTGCWSATSHVAASDVISHVRGLQRSKSSSMFISVASNTTCSVAFTNGN